jgi:hypothetical protein
MTDINFNYKDKLKINKNNNGEYYYEIRESSYNT